MFPIALPLLLILHEKSYMKTCTSPSLCPSLSSFYSTSIYGTAMLIKLTQVTFPAISAWGSNREKQLSCLYVSLMTEKKGYKNPKTGPGHNLLCIS